MPDETWKSTYEVRAREIMLGGGLGEYSVTWDVVNLYNGEIVGNYRDEKYARKQARRRYKKAIRLLEKSFTSTIEAS